MHSRLALYALLIAFCTCLVLLATPAAAQNEVTGAFEGTITDSQTGAPIAGASVQLINRETGLAIPTQTDAKGRFYRGLLAPGVYTIRVSMAGFQSKEVHQPLFVQRTGDVIPVPVTLDPVGATPTLPTAQAGAEDTEIAINRRDARRDGSYTERDATTLPLGATTLVRSFDELALLLPGVAPPPQTIGNGSGPGQGSGVGSAGQFAVNGLRSRGNNFTVDGSDNNDEDIGVRRQGFLSLVPQPMESVKEYQVITLLAPAQFGRNIGAQVNAVSKTGGRETHGAIYGMLNSSQLNARDFFDRNDSNAVVPVRAGNNQPVIIQEMGCSFLCSPLPLDYAFNAKLRKGPVLQERPLTVQGPGRDSFTFGQAGFSLGGRLRLPHLDRGGPAIFKSSSIFYFISGEGQLLNATQKKNFAVPTVEQRGVFASGATGVLRDPLSGRSFVGSDDVVIDSYSPTHINSDAIFSIFPFPNNLGGVYGPNTFTQVLPASGKGTVLSGRLDGNFNITDRQQSVTVRYNFTQDARDIPAIGEAIFSTLRPRVRTQDLSFFSNSELSQPNSAKPIFNQLRLSYGRTRLAFGEVRDTTFQLPGGQTCFDVPEFLGAHCNGLNTPFLLNAPLLVNTTVPAFAPDTSNSLSTITGPNTGPVVYATQTIPPQVIKPPSLGMPDSGIPPTPAILERQSLFPFLTTEDLLGPVGQVNIAGFNPVGVDVYNFPQRRINNTYQVADTVTLRSGSHNFAFGTDIRRTELNSDLPRNSRTIISFSSAPRAIDDNTTGLVRLVPADQGLQPFISPLDLAAVNSATGATQTLITGNSSSNINLRYYQLNFFSQDEWRLRPNLSLSYGLRYEYNTPPHEVNNRIERTFNDPLLDQIPNLRTFIDGRTRIFDPTYYNFGPRLGIAYSPDLFGRNRATVIRAGYGLFYDQILGSVVSQSRNVYPYFLTVNISGGHASFPSGYSRLPLPLDIINPRIIPHGAGNLFVPSSGIVAPNTLNTLNPGSSLNDLINRLSALFCVVVPDRQGNRQCNIDRAVFSQEVYNALNFTLAQRRLKTPLAHQYSVSLEQQLSRNVVISAAYIGTKGRNLLRFTTPNLGPDEILVASYFSPFAGPNLYGFTFPPGTHLTSNTILPKPLTDLAGGRPVNGVGTIYQFETTGSSSYNALQFQLRGRSHRSLQYQVAYTLSKANDDVSDVFDLAGASALPQNSLTLAGEWGPANFDTRHRLTYNFIYDVPRFQNLSHILRALFGGLQIASTGQFQTGQPFTVNTIYDVNLDGNNTDRLNTTDGLIVTGDRHQPLRLAPGVDPFSLLAPTGEDGKVGRNTFRAGNILELDMSVIKSIAISDRQKVSLRADIYNFINRANFGIPVRFLEAPGFGKATETVTPGRRIQLALKYSF